MSPHEALQIETDESFAVPAGEGSALERIVSDRVTPIPAIAPHNSNGVAHATTRSRSSWVSFLTGTFFRKGVLSLIDQAIVSATNFLTMVMLGRTAAQELGEYQLGFSIVLLAMCVQNALISSPYALFGNRLDGDQRARYAGNTLLHQWAYSALATLVMACIGVATAFGSGMAGFDVVAWILAGVLPLILVREFVRRVAFAHLQLITVLCVDIATSVLQLGGLLALMYTGYLSSETTFATMGVACGIAGGTTFFLMRRRFAPQRASAMDDLRRNWSFGKWAFGAQVLTLTSAYCIPWMLALMCGTAETGRYSACLSIVLIANPLLIGLNNFLGPQAIQAYHRYGLKSLRRLTLAMSIGVTGCLACLALLLILFGGQVLGLIYGHKLVGNETPVAILAFSMLFLAAGMGVENGLAALNRPKLIFWAYAAGQIVTLVACWSLIRPYGVSGAAAASVIGIVVGTTFKIVMFLRSCRGLPERSAA